MKCEAVMPELFVCLSFFFVSFFFLLRAGARDREPDLNGIASMEVETVSTGINREREAMGNASRRSPPTLCRRSAVIDGAHVRTAPTERLGRHLKRASHRRFLVSTGPPTPPPPTPPPPPCIFSFLSNMIYCVFPRIQEITYQLMRR